MASLFKNNVLKDKLITAVVPKFEERIEIIKQWHKALQDKSLLKKTETQCEQAFNDDFFVKILGYSRFPSEKYTIEVKATVETSGGQKPDAALGFFASEGNKVQCVCEIKDANTSLDKPQQREGNLTPVQQGFKYKPLYKNCGFVIVSNLREIRLYRDTLHDFEKFSLEELADPADNYSSFRKFHFLLSADNLIAESGKSETEELLASIRIEQERITKEFYREYHGLRLQLIDNILKNNKSVPFELVLEKAQKIIDRMVFIVFCEDRGLLPENKLASQVLGSHQVGLGFSVWNIMKQYFTAIDEGDLKMEVNRYNGELFKPDAELDLLTIDDGVCEQLVRLGNFNYNDDLSVNILGHIFEQSITDIEQLKDQQLEEAKNTFSKRKKDGIYYTPEYIVDFIVGSTLGKHLEELEANMLKKQGLKEGITDAHYTKRAIDAYNEYLIAISKITVLDLACGSGAFLVKVFDYLKKEHERVGQILAELTGAHSSLYSDESIIKTLLHQNIFGVDLNAESVEITKLSLWLKTAEKGKKLQELKENIKCGNSLIDDSAIDSRAFNWQKEFKSILNAGGFDIIVGNPPYVGEKGNKDIFQPIHQGEWGSRFYQGKMDLFYFFFHRGLDLLKEGGRLGFITTNYFITAFGARNLRKDLKERATIEKFANFNEIKIFEDAGGQHNMITVLKKGCAAKEKAEVINFHSKEISLPEALNVSSIQREGVEVTHIQQKDLFDGEENYIRLLQKETDSSSSDNLDGILLKLQKNGEKLDIYCNIDCGIQTGCNYVEISGQKCGGFIVSQDEYKTFPMSEREMLKPFFHTSDIRKYCTESSNTEWVIYTNREFTDIDKNPFIKDFLNRTEFRRIVDSVREVKNGITKYYQLQWPRELSIFEGEKIVCPQRASKNVFGYSDCAWFGGSGIFFVTAKEEVDDLSLKYLLGVLNSKLIYLWLVKKGKMKGGALELVRKPLSEIPIKKLSGHEQQSFIEKVDVMIQLSNELNEKIQKVTALLSAEYGIEQLSSKLDRFWELSFDEFSNALKLKKMSLQKKHELMEYFEKQKAEPASIADKIEKLQQGIDEMVFDLYELTKEEKEIVRKATS